MNFPSILKPIDCLDYVGGDRLTSLECLSLQGHGFRLKDSEVSMPVGALSVKLFLDGK